MKAVEAKWLSYRAAIVPADAGAVQVEECRRAFYAGAASMFEIVTGTGDMAEDAGVAHIESVRQELLGFPSTLRR